MIGVLGVDLIGIWEGILFTRSWTGSLLAVVGEATAAVTAGGRGMLEPIEYLLVTDALSASTGETVQRKHNY